jgi:RHS repeat-associated protein
MSEKGRRSHSVDEEGRITTGGRAMYLGKDIIGSVRSSTTDTGALEDRYEYDAFGQPYKGDLSGDMNLGYTGKPYDTATGLYNYGYRDYKSQAARFTTVDPIRDGRNWYAYVNNDPVNWVDLWGLEDILIWDATQRSDDLNNFLYNMLLDHSYSEIKKAAEETGQTVEIIKGKDATEGNLRDKIIETEPSRVITVAHGVSNTGLITDVTGNEFSLSTLQIPPNTVLIDNVACYADMMTDPVGNPANPIEVRTYNPENSPIWFYQANDATMNRIPESIRTGNDTSGPPTNNSVSAVPYSNVYAVGSSDVGTGSYSEAIGVNKYK